MIDSLTRHPTGTLFEAEICVIGAGPVGIAAAREFLDGTPRVLLLESGGEAPDEGTQSLNRGAIAGGPFTTLEEGRVRAFGGTTWTWAGQCLPLDAEALGPRPWVQAKGWPFQEAELEPYTERAASFFGVRAAMFTEGVWSEFGVKPPAFDGDVLMAKHTAYAQPVNSARAQLGRFSRSRGVRTLLHATVVQLELSASGKRVEQVEISSLDGTRARVNARAFVLCCGAIENARLLLLTSKIASRHESLGRFLQNHPRGRCARLEPIDRRTLQNQFTTFRRRGRRYLPRLVLSPLRQRDKQVLAAHANVAWTPPRSITDIAGAVLRRARGLGSASRSGEMWLVVDSEQAPHRESRVSLGRSCDAMGRPQAVVDWRLSELERRTMRAMVDAVSTEFRRLELAVVHPEGWLTDQAPWMAHISDAAHHIGTTRIATTPADGVVDENCRVHGVENLFIAGTSVFPTSGAANPTLGAVALALRLADHLKQEGIRS